MLTTDLSVVPISLLVERVDPAKENACYKALEDFLGGKFKVQKAEEDRREKQKADAEAKTREEEAKNDKPKDGKKCFPGAGKVSIIKDGLERQIAIKDLRIADLVKTVDARGAIQ